MQTIYGRDIQQTIARLNADIKEAEDFHMPVMVVSVERMRSVMEHFAQLETNGLRPHDPR